MEEAAPLRITALKIQARDKSRVNVFVNGTYRLSLDLTQVADLGIRTNTVYTEEELATLENESKFGKLYTRSLEYALIRPRSRREMRDYLYRKTRDTRTKEGGIKKGVSTELTERVYERLSEKGYIDDEKFARFWVENRNVRKGSSLRKLQSELQAKGVESSIIQTVMGNSDRSDMDELHKIIAKKAKRYDDQQKFIAYLARQGFAYDTIKQALSELDQGDADA